MHACASLGTEEQLVLPGYGVEAVLKNMEYSAMDEKSKADAAAAAAKKKLAGNVDDALAGLDASQLGEVKGFKFDVLVKRKPQLVQELMTFRDVLMSSDEEQSIKVSGRMELDGSWESEQVLWQLVQELMTFRDVLMSRDEEESIKVHIN